MKVREIETAMGRAVAERTIFRKKDNGKLENWGDVAERVALGNSLLSPDPDDVIGEKNLLQKHISQATVLMSGRHLQHGDENQPNRNLEIFWISRNSCIAGTCLFLICRYKTVAI